MRTVKKVWALVVTAVLVLLVGCTGKGPGPSPDQGKTTVRESGFTLSAGAVTVSRPAGVAPIGTEIVAQEISTPTELTELGLAGAPVLDLSLAGDLQPQPNHRARNHSIGRYTLFMSGRRVLEEAMHTTATTQSELARLSGVRQPSISQMLSGRIDMSDSMLERLLACMGFQLEVTHRLIPSPLDRSHKRSWRLHRKLARHLDADSLRTWTPTIRSNLQRLNNTVKGQPHLRNLKRWEDSVEAGDLSALRRVMTGLDNDSVEMREVSPLSGLLPESERLQALKEGQ